MCPGFRSEPTCDQIIYLIIKHLILNLRARKARRGYWATSFLAMRNVSLFPPHCYLLSQIRTVSANNFAPPFYKAVTQYLDS